MTTIDKIRAEIKKLQDIFVETAQGMETEDEATVYSMCAVEFGDEILSFLDTLEEPVSDCHDLEEAAEKFARFYDNGTCDGIAQDCFKAGAEWQKAKMMEEWLKDRDGCFWDGVNEGKKAMEEQMMEGATYNELMELYSAIRDELVKRHRDVPINIKEEQ